MAEKSVNLSHAKEANYNLDDSLNITKSACKEDSSDEDIAPGFRVLKNKHRISDSDSDIEKDNKNRPIVQSNTNGSKVSSESDSESDSDYLNANVCKTYDFSRTENRRNKLKTKFQSLLSPQLKKSGLHVDIQSERVENDSENSDDEISCLKIKKKFTKKKTSLTSVCDPDTSDEEASNGAKIKPKNINKQLISPPKQVRMSAKEAVENMKKIKSESNRMLREKDVSLPYHRPKALTLQDIMKRRKPAITQDGKTLPIKMNNEQLKQYVILLEERQKEIIELCKSDSEEPEDDLNEQDKNITNIESKESTISEIPINSDTINADDIQNTISNEVIINEYTELPGDSSHNDSKNNISLNTKDDFNTNDHINDDLTTNDDLNSKVGMDHKLHINGDLSKDLDTNDKPRKGFDSNDNMSINFYGGLNTSEVLDDNLHRNAKDINSVTNSNQKKISIETVSEVAKDMLNNEIENDTESMVLHFDSERSDMLFDDVIQTKDSCVVENNDNKMIQEEIPDKSHKQIESECNDFSDEDFCLENIDKLIEEAEIINENDQTTGIINLNNRMVSKIMKPKLTGSPGMVINLDGDISGEPKSGVEQLKERFEYFAKHKTLEEQEKIKDKKYKPGTQHLKLKLELEEQIAIQRSLEWEKRLEEEKKQKSEMHSEMEDDIEKIEAKLEEEHNIEESESSEEEEELEENDIELKDKPKVRNPMIDDEAEESEDELENKQESEGEMNDEDGHDDRVGEEECIITDDGDENGSNDEDSSEESSESEIELEVKQKKGRILKAFEDSDDESLVDKIPELESDKSEINSIDNICNSTRTPGTGEELQLAQINKSASGNEERQVQEFKVNDSENIILNQNEQENPSPNGPDLGSQTFSILHSGNIECKINLDTSFSEVLDNNQPNNSSDLQSTTKLPSESYSQCLLNHGHIPPEPSQTQEIGDDIAALCTGQFYDNPLISQTDITSNEEVNRQNAFDSESFPLDDKIVQKDPEGKLIQNDNKDDGTILKSILEELDGPDIVEKPNKYFLNKESTNKETGDTQKKRFVIDSDDESDNENKERLKKVKKRKAEKRALKISDDEDETSEEDVEEAESEIDEDTERIVDYDSEENEIVQAKPSKTKKLGEFFENEAELTSEDEWVGSGDEDEAGLDRMEREEGDSEVFHQGQLQRELGQIHMREVLDQDKREVRLLQELLFEDGDLGDGHRQRKFRWKTNADDDDDTGFNPDDILDTQEDEFESEERWRKERHERELFLKQMEGKDENEDLNISLNRTAIIKANLETSKNIPAGSVNDSPVVEKKSTKDIPSPKKPFAVFQRSYPGSLLSRGSGALARLAALAAPLANADAAPLQANNNGRNFVFAALEQTDETPKVTKRKAEASISTPKLIKKMKNEEPQKNLRNSLFDHFKS